MPLNPDSYTIKQKDEDEHEHNDTANSDSDYNVTDSESSIDNSFRRSHSSKSTLLPKDDALEESYYSKIAYSFSFPSKGMLIIVVLSILLVPLLYFFPVYPHVSQNNHNDGLMQDLYDTNRKAIQEFRKSVEDIKLKFKNQNFDTWHAFASQIEEIINESTQISIIILLGNEMKTVTCLAHLFGRISSKALSNDNYLTLNERNIGNNHGEIIDKLKAEIQIDRVVIIENLLTLNSEAIKVLHNLCDKENPLVPKSVYIITIISSDYEGLHEDKFVEDCLTAKFSKAINLDILNPLITRIIDGPIITVIPEPRMKGSKTVKECLLV